MEKTSSGSDQNTHADNLDALSVREYVEFNSQNNCYEKMPMDSEAFLKGFAEILKIPVSDIALSTELKSLESWDSLTVLDFMAFVDANFGGEVRPEDIESSRTINDLYSLAVGQRASRA